MSYYYFNYNNNMEGWAWYFAKFIGCFVCLFMVCRESTILEERYPQHFVAPHSYAHIVSGDLYGTCAPVETLRELNEAITPTLNSLRATPYFRTYKINLERECPFWAQQRLCNNQQCAICECEENEVPKFWAGAQESSQPEGFGHSVTKQ